MQNSIQPIEVPQWRQHLLRGLYLLTFVGLAFSSWTELTAPESTPWDPLHGVAFAFWSAYATLMLLGVLRPLTMLPLVLLQLCYKSLWLIFVGRPLLAAGEMALDAPLMTAFMIGVALDVLLTPWGYVFKTYFRYSRSG